MTQELQSITVRKAWWLTWFVLCSSWPQSGSRELGLEARQAITLVPTFPTVTHPPSHVLIIKGSTTSQKHTRSWSGQVSTHISLWGMFPSHTKECVMHGHGPLNYLSLGGLKVGMHSLPILTPKGVNLGWG